MATNVTRNLSQMLEERGIILESSIDELLQREFGSNFYKDVSDKEELLDNLEKILNEAEDELRNLLKKSFFDSDSVIDDIIYHLNTGQDMDNIVSMLNFNGQQSNYLKEVLSDTILSYQTKYQAFKDQFIDNLKFMGEIGEKIRGDKQFYTLGIAAKNGELRNAILTSEQWYKLISQNKYFNLQRMPDGKRVLVTNRQWTGEKQVARDKNGQIKIDPKTGQPIMTHVYSSTRGITAGELAQGVLGVVDPNNSYSKKAALQALSVDPVTQEIWDALRGSEIYTQQSIKKYFETDNEDVLSQIFSARKYEILNSGIWDSVYNEGDARIRNLKINNIIATIQRQGFDMENIFGGARGDTMLQVLGEYVSSQQKFFGNVGKKEGFQVIDKVALNNAFDFYKNQSNIQKADKQAAEQLIANPEIKQQIQQQGILAYQNSANNLFIQFFAALTGLPGVTVTESGDFEGSDDFIEAVFGEGF